MNFVFKNMIPAGYRAHEGSREVNSQIHTIPINPNTTRVFQVISGDNRVISLPLVHKPSQDDIYRILYASTFKIAESIGAVFDKVAALQNIAETHLKRGDRTGVEVTLRETRKIVQCIDDDYLKAEALLDVAQVQAKNDNIVEAKETVQLIKLIHVRNRALMSIVQIQVKNNDIMGAEKTTQLIKNEAFRAKALVIIAQGYTKRGDVSHIEKLLIEAKKNAQSLSTDGCHLKSEALEEIVRLQLKKGDVVGAEETAQLIRSEELRTEALTNIAQVRIENADIVGVKKTIRLIRTEYAQDKALASIAQIQAKNGVIAIAKTIIGWIKHDYIKSEALISIAGQQIRNNTVARVRETLREAKEIALSEEFLFFQYKALKNSAQIEAQIGDIIEAKNTMESVISLDLKSEAFVNIAQVQIQKGDIIGGSETLKEARAIAELIITSKPIRAKALQNIIWIQTQIGDIAGAEETMQLTDWEHGKAEAVQSIARAYAKNNNIAKAKEIARSIKNKDIQDELLENITEMHHEIIVQELLRGISDQKIKTARTSI